MSDHAKVLRSLALAARPTVTDRASIGTDTGGIRRQLLDDGAQTADALDAGAWALELLRRLEWASYCECEHRCPACGEVETVKGHHAPSCELATLIGAKVGT